MNDDVQLILTFIVLLVALFLVSSEKHFFTSETGAFIFGSNKSTKAAFDLAQSSLG